MNLPMKSGTETVFRSLGDVMLDAAVIFLPPERLSVSEAAEKYRKLHNPPAYIGPWKNATTPYMVEPQDMFASRYHNGLVFVGPAQSAKTDSLVLNTLCYTIVCDPADTILYSPSQASSRDFSKRRIDRMHRHTKIVGEQLLPGRHHDNTFDKFYRSGMMFTMSWPSVNEMSGKPVPRVGLTDYDRMPMDVDGEGSPFDLGQKRTTTFKSFGMTVAESSPGKEITDAKWQQETPHQAPPCEGILALYNRGDRRRWYWPCPDCHEFFQGEFSLLMYSDTGTALQRAKTVYMACPKCGSAIAPDKRFEMNRRGVWLREGETITKEGVRGGNPVVSEMASYWLKGVAAAFITWQTLVMKYLNAMEDYARTGAEEALKATVTTDQGDPYLPKSLESTRLPEDLKDQAVELQPRHIPPAVRALFAEIDVQKNRFEVQVHGIAPGSPYKVYVIDRFAIIKSDRLDEDGERRYVKPSDFPEDWDLIKTAVMDKVYPLSDLSGHMAVTMTFCDSGGKSGTTTNAYDFYRRLKKEGIENRFMLVKGDSKPEAPRARVEFPDSGRKDRFAQARGEVPVLFLNSNILKDTLNGMLDRNETGDCRIVFPNWLGEKDSEQAKFFDELTAEVRTPKGWENPLKRRNEAWDLLYYHIGACVIRRVESVDWAEPPTWLEEWDRNPMVERKKPAQTTPIAEEAQSNYGLAHLGALLG